MPLSVDYNKVVTHIPNIIHCEEKVSLMYECIVTEDTMSATVFSRKS